MIDPVSANVTDRVNISMNIQVTGGVTGQATEPVIVKRSATDPATENVTVLATSDANDPRVANAIARQRAGGTGMSGHGRVTGRMARTGGGTSVGGKKNSGQKEIAATLEITSIMTVPA